LHNKNPRTVFVLVEIHMIMRPSAKKVAGIMGSLMLCAGAYALVGDSAGNPYHGIARSNVFRLQPPPKPQPPPGLLKEPPKIILLGISTVTGRKLAYLKVLMPPKTGEQTKEQGFTLTEGQWAAETQVLEIDEKAGSVKVQHFGTTMTVTFDSDSSTHQPLRVQ